MYAGTLTQLSEPTDEPIDDYYRDGGLPALSVEQTQERVDGSAVQTGIAAAHVEQQRTEVMVLEGNPKDPPEGLAVETTPTRVEAASEWVADPEGSGLIAVESIAGSDELAFPIDVLAVATGIQPNRLDIDVSAMFDSWNRVENDSDSGVQDVWMTTNEDGDSTSMQYHDAAHADTEPNIGVGFKRSHGGRLFRGVAYESGYVALYNCDTAAAFVGFVNECVLPFTSQREGDATQQATL